MLTRMWRNWITNTLPMGGKVVQPFWKILWLFLKKRNMQLAYELVIALQGKWKHVHINTCIYMNVCSSLIQNSQRMKTTKMSFSGWTLKPTVVHPQPVGIKEKKLQIQATAYTTLQRVMLSGKSQPQRLRTAVTELLCIFTVSVPVPGCDPEPQLLQDVTTGGGWVKGHWAFLCYWL